MRQSFSCAAILVSALLFVSGCNNADTIKKPASAITAVKIDTPEYFQLRPDIEKTYGYTHAVKIGHDIKISGAVSMDDNGVPTAKGNLAQQMKNCYTDLDKILKHYNCTFDDVVVENVLTTNMPEFLKQSGFRNEIYKKRFPTGSWFGVRELALPELMIEIELEVYSTK